jgi:hypothetical protein
MILFGPPKKALMTNLFNRLRILLMEEIVFTEIGPITQSIQLLNNIESLEFEEQMQRILQFCNIVKTCKRARLVSYIRAYYKINDKNINLEDVVLENVLKYKKQKDSETLLKYGELFIKYMDEGKFINYAFNIYNILYNDKETLECSIRYRRKDPVNLLFEIIEDRYVSNKIISEFARTMFFRKSMIERHAFGFWYLCFAWKREIEYNSNSVLVEPINLIEYFQNRDSLLINDDFVVKDYHVNKTHGLAKFGNVGSIVIDEDLSILGSNGEYFRQLYVDDKNGITPKKKIIFKVISDTNDKKKKNNIKLKPINDNSQIYNNYEDSKLENIPMDKFNDIMVLEDGVCGLKVCCIKANYKGQPYILKEMRKSFNDGIDYVLVDELKDTFGLRHMNMQRFKSDKHLTRVDKSKRTLVNNWKWDDEETYYCKMELFENIGDIGKHKELLVNDSVFRECLKIRLYDGLFCSSDNILRNILVNQNKELLSIDEGDIYGKRKEIFNKNDWFLKPENKSRANEMSKNIIDYWDLENKIIMVKDALIKYGFSDKVDIMTKRFLDYKNIVCNELK